MTSMEEEDSTITDLYVARHGQTTWNAGHIIQGSLDSPLSDRGIRQAELLGKRLSDVNFDCIFSSSSERAYRTAEIIRGERKCPIVKSDSFKEISLGEWEGMSRGDARDLYPGEFRTYWNRPEEFLPVGQGETFAQVRARVIPALNEILEQYHGATILLVAHTVVVKLILAHFESRPLEQLWEPPRISPASLSHVAVNGKSSRILEYGDISHYRKPWY